MNTPTIPDRPDAESVLLARDLKRLTALSDAMAEIADESKQLQARMDSMERGYFTSEEHDTIEELLYRYLSCREALWGLIDFHRKHHPEIQDEEERTRAFVIGLAAAVNLYYYSGIFIEDFMDAPSVIDKLNQADQRYAIPKNTYKTVFKSLTDPDSLQAIRAAGELYKEEMARPASALARLAADDPAYRHHMAQIADRLTEAHKRLDHILERRSLLLPGVRNALRHTEITALAKASLHEAGDALYAIRGLASTRIGKLRKPGSRPVIFTQEQIQDLRALLQPGDVMLTYGEGYVSNLFLPGSFKHGITYVGSVEERRAGGLERIAEKAPIGRQDFVGEALLQQRLADGTHAELIEAVAEGVIFNSLDAILTNHINRFVVWRPNLRPEERSAQLGNLFAFLGSPYDFRFDFNDATYQCCTELVYRCLNGIGPLRLELTPRMGRPTMSADDLCNYALNEGPEILACVALGAATDGGASTKGRLYTGDEALAQLRAIMG